MQSIENSADLASEDIEQCSVNGGSHDAAAKQPGTYKSRAYQCPYCEFQNSAINLSDHVRKFHLYQIDGN